MKYIKTFQIFETLTKSEQDELKEFCDEYLIHLYEKGYSVSYTIVPRVVTDLPINRMFITIKANKIQKPTYVIRDGVRVLDNHPDRFIFSWSKVRDHIIPFIDVLNDNYELGNFGTLARRRDIEENIPIRFAMQTKEFYYTASEIINGHRLRHDLKEIVIMVMGKKE